MDLYVPRTSRGDVKKTPPFRFVKTWGTGDIVQPEIDSVPSNNGAAFTEDSFTIGYASPAASPRLGRKWTLETITCVVKVGNFSGDVGAIYWDDTVASCGIDFAINKNDATFAGALSGGTLVTPYGDNVSNLSTRTWPLTNPLVTQHVSPDNTIAATNAGLSTAMRPINPLGANVPLPQGLALLMGEYLSVAARCKPVDKNAAPHGPVLCSLDVTMQVLDEEI